MQEGSAAHHRKRRDRGVVSAKEISAASLKMEMPKHQCFWQSREIAKELKPQGTKGNHHGVSADIQKHRMAGFGLRRIRRFDDA